jgi:hypothetical protein
MDLTELNMGSCDTNTGVLVWSGPSGISTSFCSTLAQRYLRREADQGAEGKTEERGEEEEEEARAGSKLDAERLASNVQRYYYCRLK